VNFLNTPLSPGLSLPRLKGRLSALAVRTRVATCGICRASVSVRKSAARKPGIEIGPDWFCSAGCFGAAVEERLLDIYLSSAANGASSDRGVRPDRMPLNLLLFARGCLTHPQSIEAARQSKNVGGSMNETLVRLGYVTEEQITQTRAVQAGYPVYSLKTDRPADTERHPDTATPALFGISIPQTLIDRYSMMPIHFVPATRRLLLGFVHKVEHGLLYAVEQMTGTVAEPCFLSPGDFEALKKRTPSHSLNDVVDCEEGARPAAMAQVISNCAVQMSADEARLRRTRDYLWVRLRSESREVDLLFPKPWAGVGRCGQRGTRHLRSGAAPGQMGRGARGKRPGIGASLRSQLDVHM
jgi:hypothetical protein